MRFGATPRARARGSARGGCRGLLGLWGRGIWQSWAHASRRARTQRAGGCADAVRGLQIDRGQGIRGREGTSPALDGVALAAGGRGWRNQTLVLTRLSSLSSLNQTL